MVYISLSILVLYIIYVIINKGIPHSLSSTYYDFGLVFSLVILISSSMIFPRMLEITSENFLFLPFLMFSGVLFVAAAPNFLSDNLIDKVHTVSAIITFISSQIWVFLMNPVILFWWIPLLIYIYLNRKYKLLDIPKIKFLAELIMFLTVYSILI